MARYCTNCGMEIRGNAQVCLGCGCRVSNQKTSGDKAPGFWLIVLCLFIPILGFAFYFVYKDEAHSTAVACLICSIINIVLTGLLVVLFALLPILLELLFIFI